MMEDEKNLFSEEKIFYKNLIQTVIGNINKKGMFGYYADDKESARNISTNLINSFINKDGGTIGIADSTTVHQIGLFEELYKIEKVSIINPFYRLEDGRYGEFENYKEDERLSSETYNAINRKIWEKARQALLSDVFITGVNAITINGQLVSTDGVGNRIAGIIYGPYKVILIVGRNKIVSNVDDAINRIKNLAAPLNHLRHGTKHKVLSGLHKLGNLPCISKGYCIDCGSELCARKCTMIMDSGTGGIFRNRIHIIIINENLGC